MASHYYMPSGSSTVHKVYMQDGYSTEQLYSAPQKELVGTIVSSSHSATTTVVASADSSAVPSLTSSHANIERVYYGAPQTGAVQQAVPLQTAPSFPRPVPSSFMSVATSGGSGRTPTGVGRQQSGGSASEKHRGRRWAMQQVRQPKFGVWRKPETCQEGREECVAACRQAVRTIVEECKASCYRYEDPDFPRGPAALFVNAARPAEATRRQGDMSDEAVTWRRLGDSLPGKPIVGETRLSWGLQNSTAFLAALAALALGPGGSSQAGAHHPSGLVAALDLEVGVAGVVFYKEGVWVYEVVDDFLPFFLDGSLALSSAVLPANVWVPLVEKAYAKLHGCYERLCGLSVVEALSDLTGAACFSLEVAAVPLWAELWEALRHMHSDRSCALVAKARPSEGGLDGDGFLDCGLLEGMWYPIVGFVTEGGSMHLELANPWPAGGWIGEGAPPSARDRPDTSPLSPPEVFRVPLELFCRHFTSVAAARLFSPYWWKASCASSATRPCLPEVAVLKPARLAISVSLPDARLASAAAHDGWSLQAGASDPRFANGPSSGVTHQASAGALKLRVYRVRTQLHDACHKPGGDPASPWSKLELVCERPAVSSRGGERCTAVCEFEAKPEFTYLVRAATSSKQGGVRNVGGRLLMDIYADGAIRIDEMAARHIPHFEKAASNPALPALPGARDPLPLSVPVLHSVPSFASLTDADASLAPANPHWALSGNWRATYPNHPPGHLTPTATPRQKPSAPSPSPLGNPSGPAAAAGGAGQQGGVRERVVVTPGGHQVVVVEPVEAEVVLEGPAREDSICGEAWGVLDRILEWFFSI